MDVVTKQHSEMLEYIMDGKTPTEISRLMNVSRSTIYNWLKLEYVQVELENRKADLRRQAKDKINSKVNLLVDNMMELACNSSDQRVRLQANKYLLDRSLGVPTAAKEDNIDPGDSDKNKDSNQLKKELEDIKNLK